ncbi:hypothetical protein, conserved [Trypanosoma brucei brucei TREU927]|uniref:Uncharacterized protein n=1 Tax=Trypanosoma brucei brucei (strain 927/4 GUTat10.1) TaxID=185431 RepID=Q583Q8_TRYB2|nr:hypothetical protein, conserved [Trypanosoma brucei brucei TREU927]AAX80979.1 hypothetical protein, conserved [Trypanosoma brucei]AAZ11838.1 hypothetical protein, conserved [Trypanosoma brucei brucei TREU927]
MPAPLATFTKTKWLTFFAELTAKITHHNLLVVLEGCELVKRLLVSRVSVAAFLEEGNFLLLLVDSLVGNMLNNEPFEVNVPIGTNEKLIFTQLETLSLFVDMMVALHADSDPYYCLLVQARAGVLLGTLVSLLRRQQSNFFGIIAIMVKALLDIPLGRAVTQSQTCGAPSVALACHLQQLQTSIEGHMEILQESSEILKGLSTTPNLVMRHCAQLLFNLVSKQLKRIRRIEGGKVFAEGNTGTDGDSRLGCGAHVRDETVVESPFTGHCAQTTANYGSAFDPSGSAPSPGISADGTKLSISREDTEETIVTEEADVCVPSEEYTECFEQLARSRSHGEYLCGMNSLWCLTVVGGTELQRHFTTACFEKAFRRFLQTMPANNQDHIVFSSILLWLSHMMSNHHICDETRECIFSLACPALIELVLEDIRSDEPPGEREDNSTVTNSFPHTSTDNIDVSSFLSAGSFMRYSSIHSAPSTVRASCTKLAERPSASFLILSFLLITERSCGQRVLERWVRHVGLFAMIEKLIRRVAHVKSVLVDTPTTTDGVLSDEVYLSCAMNTSRTEHVALGALACKLLSSIAWNHGPVIGKQLASETSRMLQTIIPLLLQIAVHNPTLTSAVENVSGSALHYLPTSQRSARYTSLGECSLVALDACFWVMETAQLSAVSLESVIPNLQALSRATGNSIHPALRAAPYRAVARLCQSTDDVLLVASEMPSLLKAAVNSVLEYSVKVPQWEAAAAAEGLIHIVNKTSSDINVEKKFSFSRSALPVKLLELAALNGITYATGTFLSLMVVLFAQQKRLAEHADEEPLSCVLLPCGRASLEYWSKLINIATWSGERLLVAHKKVIPASPVTKDAQSRALGSIEGIAVQFYFVSALSRALQFLLGAYPEYRSHFSEDVVWLFFTSTFALPSPREVFQMLFVRFGVKVSHHNSIERAYECMLQWTIELFLFWVGDVGIGVGTNSKRKSQKLASLPSKLFDSLCGIMQNAKVSQQTRANVCGLVSAIIIRTGSGDAASTTGSSSACASLAILRETLYKTLDAFSAKLFSASINLGTSSCVSGMQCRLVSLFAGANERARQCGWFEERLAELNKRMRELKEKHGVLSAHELDSLLVLFSSVFSVIAYPKCPALSQKLQQQLCLSLHGAVGYGTTRRAAFQTALALTRSEEGRRFLLQEVTACGDPLVRTCFGRLLMVTLDLADDIEPSYRRKHYGSKNKAQNATIIEREANRTLVKTLGFEVCATACAEGCEAFTNGVLKSKGVERVEGLFLKCEQERIEVPLSVHRLIAAISFHADAQLAIIRRKELMTLLVEWAGELSVAGTLALLTLRNLCFNPSLKAQLCQNDRILQLFKQFVCMPVAPQPLQALQPDNNSSEFDAHHTDIASRSQQNSGTGGTRLERHKKGGIVSTTTATASCQADNLSILRCKELAVTGYWALMYDNQRGKSHVRNVLSQAPAVKINSVVAALDQLCVEPSERACVEHVMEAVGNMKALGRSVS